MSLEPIPKGQIRDRCQMRLFSQQFSSVFTCVVPESKSRRLAEKDKRSTRTLHSYSFAQLCDLLNFTFDFFVIGS